MNKTKTDRLIFRSILSILLLTFIIVEVPAITANASELVILYSNDMRGDTEPCG